MAISEFFIRYLQRRQELSAGELCRLRALSSERVEFESGEFILSSRNEAGRSGIMLQGMAARVHRNMTTPDSRVITGLYFAGDFIELQGFVTRPPDSGIVSMGRSSVEFVRQEELQQVAAEYPGLARLFWMTTAIDAEVLRQWQVAATSLRSSAHLAHLFCELYTRLASVGAAQDLVLNLPILQREVAEILGYSAIHVNRAARDLRDRGLVRWIGSEVVILDWEGLKRLARFDPSYLSLVN